MPNFFTLHSVQLFVIIKYNEVSLPEAIREKMKSFSVSIYNANITDNTILPISPVYIAHPTLIKDLNNSFVTKERVDAIVFSKLSLDIINDFEFLMSKYDRCILPKIKKSVLSDSVNKEELMKLYRACIGSFCKENNIKYICGLSENAVNIMTKYINDSAKPSPGKFIGLMILAKNREAATNALHGTDPFTSYECAIDSAISQELPSSLNTFLASHMNFIKCISSDFSQCDLKNLAASALSLAIILYTSALDHPILNRDPDMHYITYEECGKNINKYIMQRGSNNNIIINNYINNYFKINKAKIEKLNIANSVIGHTNPEIVFHEVKKDKQDDDIEQTISTLKKRNALLKKIIEHIDFLNGRLEDVCKLSDEQINQLYDYPEFFNIFINKTNK